jgi:hypothetical protein
LKVVLTERIKSIMIGWDTHFVLEFEMLITH